MESVKVIDRNHAQFARYWCEIGANSPVTEMLGHAGPTVSEPIDLTDQHSSESSQNHSFIIVANGSSALACSVELVSDGDGQQANSTTLHVCTFINREIVSTETNNVSTEATESLFQQLEILQTQLSPSEIVITDHLELGMMSSFSQLLIARGAVPSFSTTWSAALDKSKRELLRSVSKSYRGHINSGQRRYDFQCLASGEYQDLCRADERFGPLDHKDIESNSSMQATDEENFYVIAERKGVPVASLEFSIVSQVAYCGGSLILGDDGAKALHCALLWRAFLFAQSLAAGKFILSPELATESESEKLNYSSIGLQESTKIELALRTNN